METTSREDENRLKGDDAVASEVVTSAEAIAALHERLSSSHPIKLFGRTREQREILDVYQRVRRKGDDDATKHNNGSSTTRMTEFILLSGRTGTGKTKLAETLAPIVIQDGGYCATGKFDQLMQLQKPNCAFVEAFTSFAASVQERGEAEKIRKAVNDECTTGAEEINVLLDMIPALKQVLVGGIIPEEEPDEGGDNSSGASENFYYNGGWYSSPEAVSRFKYAFRVFLRAIASPERPFVLVLDDIHWGDEAALDLLLSLLTDTSNRGVLFVGTFRDDADTTRLDSMMNKLRKLQVRITRLSLQNLDEATSNSMISNILSIGADTARSLTSIVFNRTNGNVYFILEFLRALLIADFLHYESERGERWKYDADEIRVEFVRSIDEVIRTKIKQLPENVLQTLKYASCFGAKLDVNILHHLMGEEVSVLLSYLEVAAGIGLLRYKSLQRVWVFSHDAIQEATYQTISRDDRKSFHYRIGRRLWKCFDMKELDRNIFVIVGQLTVGQDEIKEERERIAVAKLCLRAAERSVQVSSFQSAYSYLVRGIGLLGHSRCWRDEYALSVNLYSSTAEVAYCTGRFEEVHSLTEAVLNHATCINDTLRSHSTIVHTLGSSGRIQDAVKYGLEVLRDLGVNFPARPNSLQTYIALHKVRRRLRRKSSESLLRLPVITDPKTLAAMHILNLLFFYTFLHDKELTPLIGMRIIRITLDHGLGAVSCIGFVLLGMLLCGFANDIEEGYRLGKVGLAMHEKFSMRVWLPRVWSIYYLGVHMWKNAVGTTLAPFRTAYSVGLETGDIEFGLAAGISCAWCKFETGTLHAVELEYQHLRDQMTFYSQETTFAMTKPSMQAMHNLMGRAHGDPTVLVGDIMDDAVLENMRQTNKSLFLFAQFHMLMLSYYFGKYEKAAFHSRNLQSMMVIPLSALDGALIFHFDGLVAVQNYRLKGQRKMRRCALKQLRCITQWAKHSPHIFLCRQFLLEAEIATITGDHSVVHSKYIAAIALAKDSGSLSQVALANELAGKYFLKERRDSETARPFLREALVYYEKWGAQAKVSHLSNELQQQLKIVL